ncbi:MAG: glycosyltransferase family 4 protein, partial [Bacteroidales bacterium]
HTFLGILYARREHADILHIHAVGPALLAPIAKMLGMKVIVTHHGADYDRQKWNAVAKFVLKQGEKLGVKYADRVIVISKSIRDDIHRKYPNTNLALIYNGVPQPVLTVKTDYITQLGLSPYKYVLALGRFVEEKGFDDLIKAFSEIEHNGYKLVLAGDADHKTEYSVRLKGLAKENGVILTGFIKGKRLNEIMTHSALFVLPSYHEGLPISLLEAMSYGKEVVVSNIPANCLTELSASDFFDVGSITSLKEILEIKLAKDLSLKRDYDMYLYNWEHIANQTIALYKELL